MKSEGLTTEPGSVTTSTHYTVQPAGRNPINPHWIEEDGSSRAQLIFPSALFQGTE